MRVIVASLNPVKIRAVERGYARLFADHDAQVEGRPGESGVSDQPMTGEETLAGAHNRAQAVCASVPEADCWLGIEGGIEDSASGMAAFAWVVALSGKAQTRRIGQGRTATFMLPEAVAELVRDGMELGQADDQVFGRVNSKQADGAIGLLTRNVIDRTALYEQAVITALISLANPALYPYPAA